MADDAKAAVNIAPGLTKQILKEGEGEVVPPGHEVLVHYTGTLLNGTEFDSSRTGEPFQFILGQGEVIPGWDKGVETMKVNERCILRCEPEMGYGEAGAGDRIPPNSTLVFDIELLSHREAPGCCDGCVIL
eukprot:gb/GEZN01029385.1/.p1 GENE.gb/GEZN01029385.1/~~gb/GEZN01029385.1/.p1  ORF type:complete len:131 (-),score=5.83 gb/GEZN01029385.1/:73-465(-)